MQFEEYAESQKWHIGRGITKEQQIPKEFDQRKRMYNLSKELKFACLWRLENNFVFDQNFPYNNIMQLKGDKHEIENTQQEFPRPCLIYRSNYEDFKCFNNKIRWFDAWLNICNRKHWELFWTMNSTDEQSIYSLIGHIAAGL